MEVRHERRRAGLTLVELEGILQRTDPSVLLVPPRILRRVIKQDRGLSGLGLQVPHYKSYVLGRDALLRIADRDELRIAPGRELPETVILLPQPDPSRLRSRSAASILLVSWRFLFHARVHAALAARNLDAAAVADRVRRLGTTAFSEARSVLQQENFLLPASGAHAEGEGQTVYEEFTAVYLELRYFARHLLPRYFPASSDFDAVDRLLAEDVNADDLFTQTRPEGAPLPEAIPEDHVEQGARTPGSSIVVPADPSQSQNAASAAALGNDVRAARLHFRAGNRLAALDALSRLTDRLQKALHFPPAEAAQWRIGLEALLEPAAGGLWPVEARLLYDLQNACINQEKEIYALDLVEWAVTWGQRPVKRLLPHEPFVLTVKFLRRALRRLAVTHLPDDVRSRLRGLVSHALHHAEKRLREHFRPLIRSALDDVDLRPTNFCEKVARDTVVEEMLDRVVERGFLTMSDLRDVLARNRLKLPDVPDPGEVVMGDKLLKANRRLAVALDGVYRRGEIYLRLAATSQFHFLRHEDRPFPRALSDPADRRCLRRRQGTATGRGRGGAPQQPHRPAGEQRPRSAAAHRVGHRSGLSFETEDIVPILAASVFFLGLLHSAVFRCLVWTGLCFVARCLRLLFHDVPAKLIRLSLVRSVLESRPYLLLYLYALKPLIWAAPAALVLYLANSGIEVAAAAGGVVFLGALVLLNSRLGLRPKRLVPRHWCAAGICCAMTSCRACFAGSWPFSSGCWRASIASSTPSMNGCASAPATAGCRWW